MRASQLVVITADRRLCVLFRAGATRYLLDARRVREVVRGGGGGAHLAPADVPVHALAPLLGGHSAGASSAAVVLDLVPPVALAVEEVEGVYDCAALPRWPIHGRLLPLLAPAISGALEFEGRLAFELDADGVLRGLPRQVKPIERHQRSAARALVFTQQGETLAIPLEAVVQVLEATNAFNRAPNAGSFLGAALHRGSLCPVYTVGPLGLVGPYVVLCEVGGELLGLSAGQVLGVRSGPALEGVPVLDLGRMFS